MITGTVALSRMLWISAGPPRGTRQSTNSVHCITARAPSWVTSSTSATASAGRPALTTPSRSASATTRLVCNAVLEPRSSAALPDFKQIPAASEVTLGRFS